MKNNVIYIEEMYSTIRELLLRAMPYSLTSSEIERDFLQVYAGNWIDDKEVKIRLERDRALCIGGGIEYAKSFQNRGPFETPNHIVKIKNALKFEEQPEECSNLCDDIKAMTQWLLQEEYIVKSGPFDISEYFMTFKLLDRKTF